MEPIRAALTEPEAGEVKGIAFTRGRLGSMPVVVGLTGVGKTNVGVALGVLGTAFRVRRVVFSGTGARVRPELRPGFIVVAREAFFHDAGDLRADGMHLRAWIGPDLRAASDPFLRPDARLLATALEAAGDYEPAELIALDGEVYPTTVRAGRIATGDLFSVNQWKLDEVRGRFEADLLEMEGAAVAQACQALGIPWLLIRGGSDLLGAGDATADYRKYAPVAARQAALFTLHVLERLAEADARGAESP
jgi:nucleoside phosphorylase